ncbi:Multiple RNA-binding domain-containing protein 1 [Oleoguttula sp. CCFEE 5521]
MASSRIFVKGLPPSLTEVEFRKHFSSQGREITDARLFVNRRIGYVGYKTPEEAVKAVKYFNKTFMRMSRIGVEVARPVAEAKTGAPTAPVVESGKDAATSQAARLPEKVASTEKDAKLQEFLEVMKPKSKKRSLDHGEAPRPNAPRVDGDQMVVDGTTASDDEYDTVPTRTKRARIDSPSLEEAQTPPVVITEVQNPSEQEEIVEDASEAVVPEAITDDDWARSRTSRLLGLLDDEEEERGTQPTAAPLSKDASDDESEKVDHIAKGTTKQIARPPTQTLTPPSDQDAGLMTEVSASTRDGPVPEESSSSMRLFVRNLPYDVTKDALQDHFAEYGHISEIHVPLDHKTGAAKGFAYLQFEDASAADAALAAKDGQTFQGRLMHILPAAAKRESKLNDFEVSKLPLKQQQQIKKRREAASSTFNWNALYMNADAIVSSVADRLGLAKSEVLDPTSSGAAVKQAHAETHIIQETKSYFKSQGVDLDAFKHSERGDTAILIKNIPYDCSKDELKRLFEEHGEVKRFLMPPSGTLAVLEFVNAAQAKTAFGALAYRKIKGSVLFLEKAPKDLFKATPTGRNDVAQNGVSKISTNDLKIADADMVVADGAGTATLFVRNLNFDTTNVQLSELFQPLSGFLTAKVKTRTDPKKPGKILSMGFGFLEFRAAADAQAALLAMDGYALQGHKLQLRASHKGADAAEDRRRTDKAKREHNKSTKVVVKNLPFEATKKDVRALFGAYGQLRSVRVPKKMDNGARGFAFAEFATPKDAENAIEALKDTHLLGRRLVLDFATEDPDDAEAEIERMQKRVEGQVNKVALQKLTSGGRKRFTTQGDDEDV